MAFEALKEKAANKISTVTIGATKAEGGTRRTKITVGGESCLAFHLREGEMPNPPVIAMEVYDRAQMEWPAEIANVFGGKLKEPGAWAEKCVKECGAQMICLRLQSAHPDYGNASPNDCAKTVKEVLSAVDVPLIVCGPGQIEKDNEVLPVASQAAAGEKCLFGSAVQDNYKTLAASCLADGHSVIAQSPIDINIAKQVNILLSEMGIPGDRIVIDPTVGAVGYGIEYAYSIMERGRLAALGGDKMMAMPVICFVGRETWRAKESNVDQADVPTWGPAKERGILWEALTASVLLVAGADILVMRHPKSVELVREQLKGLLEKSGN